MVGPFGGDCCYWKQKYLSTFVILIDCNSVDLNKHKHKQTEKWEKLRVGDYSGNSG